MIIKYNGIDKVTYILEGISNIKVDNNIYKELPIGVLGIPVKKIIKFKDRLVNCGLPYNGDFKVIHMKKDGEDFSLGVRGEAVICTDSGAQIDIVRV